MVCANPQKRGFESFFHASFNYETFYAVDFFTQVKRYERPYVTANQSFCWDGNFGVNFTKTLSRTGVCSNFNTDKDFLDLETLDDVTLCF